MFYKRTLVYYLFPRVDNVGPKTRGDIEAF